MHISLKNSVSSKKNTGDYYQAGDIIDHYFKVISKLGQGGYSQVYKVELISLDSRDLNSRTFLQKDLLNIGDKLALKVEKVNVVTRRLKSEAAILQKLACNQS